MAVSAEVYSQVYHHTQYVSVLSQGMVENRKCRDVLFLLFFVAYWVGMFVVCGIAFREGEHCAKTGSSTATCIYVAPLMLALSISSGCTVLQWHLLHQHSCSWAHQYCMAA
jgi:hypothetical protein